MAHNLAIDENGVAAMAYNAQGGKPWHGLGQPCEGAMNSEEALKMGHLDYTVEKTDLFATYQNGKDAEIIPVTSALKQKAVIRTDNKAVLGIVGENYHPIQNIDSFKFFDDIVAKGAAIYETVGALGKGEKNWIMAKLPETIKVKRGFEDIVENYLLLYNSHDGSSKVRIRPTPVRVVCNNTLTMALQGKCKEFSVRHTKNAEIRMKEAKELFGIIQQEIVIAAESFQLMANKMITKNDVKAFLEALIPIKQKDIDDGKAEGSTRRSNICHEIIRLFETGLGNKGETVWDLYNGVTQYVDHHRVVKNGANRWENATFDSGLIIKTDAYELAMALAKS